MEEKYIELRRTVGQVVVVVFFKGPGLVFRTWQAMMTDVLADRGL